MDVTRVNQGERIAGIAGILFIIIMFLHWWSGPSFSGFGVHITTSFNAWQPADFMDIVWFICGLSGVVLFLMAANNVALNMPVAMSAVTTGLGTLGTVLILYRIIDPPYSLGRSYGVWLGLIAMGAMTYGAYMAMQEEGTSFSREADRVRGPRGPGGGSGGSAPPPPPPSNPPSA
jgi:hypothetical protein